MRCGPVSFHSFARKIWFIFPFHSHHQLPFSPDWAWKMNEFPQHIRAHTLKSIYTSSPISETDRAKIFILNKNEFYKGKFRHHMAVEQE